MTYCVQPQILSIRLPMTTAFAIHTVLMLILALTKLVNADLIKIMEWGCTNRVEFNARKTQCCLLTHKRISDPGQNVCMGGMAIDVLGTSIRSELRWDDHVFNVSKEAAIF